MVELVGAAAILFIILAGIMGAVEYAGANTRMASMRQAAIDVAQAQIEYDRNLPWSSLGLKYSNGMVGNPAGSVWATQTVTSAGKTYTVSTRIAWNVDTSSASSSGYRESTKQLTVTVAWISPVPGSVTIETAVFGQGTTVANAGDVHMTAVDVENPSTTLAGIGIILGPYSGTTQYGTTGSDGNVLMANVPMGKIKSLAPQTPPNPTWLVDVSGIGLPTVASGWNDWGFVYCQKPASATFHVKSSSIANIAGAKIVLTDTGTHAATYTGYTDSNGLVTFGAGDNCNGLPGLWKSNYYSAVASMGTLTSSALAFSISAGGQAYSGELTIPDPPSIKVSMKTSSTGVPITGRTWTVTLKNPSGVSLGTYTTSADSYTYPISVAGNYTAVVTGVSGFLDNPGFTFTATASGANQACVVPMSPLFMVGVRAGGSLVSVPATVTMTKTSGGSSVASVAIAGQAGFVIPSDGTYNVSAVVNGVTYTGTQTTLVAASPPAATYYIDLNLGKLSVAASALTGSRWVGVYDASKALVASILLTTASPTYLFTLQGGGNYVVTICGNTYTPPATQPVTTANKYRDYPTTSPYYLVVPTDGTTYTLSGMQAPN